MSLSVNLFSRGIFAPPLTLPNAQDWLFRHAQAADAEEMERLVRKQLAEVVAINAAIGAPTGQNPDMRFTPADSNLAGAGDGHTFLFTTLYSRVPLAAAQRLLIGEVLNGAPGDEAFNTANFPYAPGSGAPVFIDPALFVLRFGLASSQESVALVMDETINKVLTDSNVLLGVNPPTGPSTRPIGLNFLQVAGSAKGTRFMCGAGGVVFPPPAP
jgi:hypothetical protein